MSGGEELVFRELNQRSPVKVAGDRVGEVMEETFGPKIMKNETTESFTGRSRLAFTRLQTEGVNLPSGARGLIVLRGCRLGSLGRATIMSATRRSWEFEEVCTAIQTSFLLVHLTGGRMELLGWMKWMTELNVSLRRTWTSEVTRSLNPKLRPSWAERERAMWWKSLRLRNKPERP